MSDLIKRLFEKDITLWSTKKKDQTSIANRLGWLNSPEFLQNNLKQLTDFAKQIKKRRIPQIALLGMGGSSLCPYLFSSIFGSAPGFPNLFVLDSTDPDYIKQVQARINLPQTFFIFSSKSGTTIEPNCLFKYFYTQVYEQKSNPGQNFIAITDPETALVKMAQEDNFAHIFINPPDIGGRFSALSYFGLVPAAAIGMNISALKDSLQSMYALCKNETDNPALELGKFMADCVCAGKDKMTLLMDSCLEPMGLWLEQLIAESTGKDGTGVIPVVGEPLTTSVDEYGPDRCFVSIGLKGHENKKRLELITHLEKTGAPLKCYTISDPYQLAGEFYRWEMATALCGHFLGINPFDEPNVAESKKNTSQILEKFTTYGKMPLEISGKKDEFTFQFSNKIKQEISDQNLRTAIKHILGSLSSNKYFGILLYLPYQQDLEEIIRQIRVNIRNKTGCAAVLGFGPRYLHSSGQLHKGGPDTGSFIILTRDEKEISSKKNLFSIPGETYNFGQLQFAQGLGDFQSLSEKGRAVIHLQIGPDYKQSLINLQNLIAQVLDE